MLRNEVRASDPNFDHIKQKIESFGITVDSTTGHLFYTKKYSPMEINYELVLIRHGETYGNCGQITADGKIDVDAVKSNVKDSSKRIFQGDVDEEINQLTENGKYQARYAALQLENEFLTKFWIPDYVFYLNLLKLYLL